MKHLLLPLLVCSLLVSSAVAAEPADAAIKGALSDVEKYEKQFAASTPVNKAAVNRTLKLLTLTKERLDASPNQTDASWKEVDARRAALVARLSQMLDPANANAVTKPAAGPAASAPASTPRVKEMISQERVRVRKLARDVESVLDTMNQGGVKPFQDKAYVDRFQQSYDRFKETLDRYADFKTDPDVKVAAEKLAEFENLLAFGRNHAAKEIAELGDVQERLAALEADLGRLSRPDVPAEPYEKDALVDWVKRVAAIRQAVVKLHEPLPAIKERAHLPDTRLTVGQGGAYDFNDVLRLERAMIERVNTIDRDVEKLTEHLAFLSTHLKTELENNFNFDPANPVDQARHFLTEGRAGEVRTGLSRRLQTATEAAAYARLLNQPTLSDRLELVELARRTAERYETDYLKARELVRMPKPATDDAELRSIATRTLAGYDMVGEIERLVINADKRRLKKETSEEKFDQIDVSLSGEITLTGTKTTYFYEWYEFQVATAEPVGDKHFIFYNTLKYFTSGSSITPLNKWVIGGRFQGAEIPRENIAKN